MMRSMFSGVSGLRTHQNRMDVIANNISNVNTVGFKSSRVTFNDIFSQTISGATRANEETGRGGVNPMQIGLGVAVGSIDTLMTQGAAQTTNNSMDLMLEGDGFFVVGDNTGTYFTRAGVLNLDADGNLVIANGMKVQGWEAVPDPQNPGKYKIQKDTVQPITIKGDKEYSEPEKTSHIEFSGNLDPHKAEDYVSTISFYDSLGTRYIVDVNFKPVMKEETAEDGSKIQVFDKWQYSISDKAYPNGDRSKNGVDLNIGTELADIKFDENGKILEPKSITIAPKGDQLNPPSEFGAYEDEKDDAGDVILSKGEILISFENLTQFSNETDTPKSEAKDGYGPGKLSGISISNDGTIVGSYSNGKLRELGQISVAQFSNPAGLESLGGNLFAATSNSGEWNGVGSIGKMRSGTLEMSNVDLAQEFTDMITTQRGFQANSRIISTSDDMLQELVSLKR